MKQNFFSRILLVIVALSLLSFGTVASAAKKAGAPKKSEQSYEQLRDQFLRLRNTDISISRLAEWESLIDKLNKFSQDFKNEDVAAAALYQSASMLEQIYRHFGGEDRIKDAIATLERLASEHPTHMLADDALVRAANLTMDDLNNVEEAQRLYLKVVAKYKKSDMVEVARVRLSAIKSGEYEALQQASKRVIRPVVEEGGKRILVVLDPGHGGEDDGAKGLGGLLEKDVTLAVALDVERILSQDKRFAVRLTRRRDVFVPLEERVQFANDFEADLYISIHANASDSGKLSGIETYYLDPEGDHASMLLAERENAAKDGFSNSKKLSDVQFMVSDLIQYGKQDESIVLAHSVQRAISNHLSGKWDGIKDVGVRKAPFYVLVGAKMPCILVELSYIDHRVDGEHLSSKDFRHDTAQGVAMGIRKFVEK